MSRLSKKAARNPAKRPKFSRRVPILWAFGIMSVPVIKSIEPPEKAIIIPSHTWLKFLSK
jgi:hypothetical protein